MSRYEVCGAARLSVHFLMFGFSTPTHAQTKLVAQQPRSSAATSSTNDVSTTSEFETWRWPPSPLLSSLRPAALAHQPGSHSSASPSAMRQSSRCHTLLLWTGCGAAVSFSLLRSAVMCLHRSRQHVRGDVGCPALAIAEEHF